MICFLLMTFSKGLTLLNFYFNQEAITAKFCVNKSRPKMQCNGKCFLAKQIKEQEQRDATNAVLELSKIEVVSFTSYFINDLERFYTVVDPGYRVYSEKPNTALFSKLLKPPRA